MEDILSSSPDSNHDLRLIYKSEIRFGPAYYTAYLDGALLKGRHFGSDYLWSSDSNYLVLLEWRSIDPNVGADIFVSIYDLKNGLLNAEINESNGWIKLKSIEGSVVSLEREVYKWIRRRKIEIIDITLIDKWEPISSD